MSFDRLKYEWPLVKVVLSGIYLEAFHFLLVEVIQVLQGPTWKSVTPLFIVAQSNHILLLIVTEQTYTF